MKKSKLEEEFNILSNEEIKQANDIASALALINQEGCINNDPIEEKKFIVEKNEKLKELTSKASFEEKNEYELDEIADQANQAFHELMDIAINTQGKACGDIASSAQSFLNIKFNAKMAKLDAKYKKLNYELQLKKLDMMTKKTSATNEDEEDDDIIIIEQ